MIIDEIKLKEYKLTKKRKHKIIPIVEELNSLRKKGVIKCPIDSEDSDEKQCPYCNSVLTSEIYHKNRHGNTVYFLYFKCTNSNCKYEWGLAND